MKHRLTVFSILVVLAMVLSACGQQATPTAAPEPTAVPPVVEPTAVPVVEPTAEPVVEPEPAKLTCAEPVKIGLITDLTGALASSYLKCMSHTCAGNLSTLFRLQGPFIASCTACVSGSQGIGFGYEAIRSGKAEIMITGGAEEMHFLHAAVFDLMLATSSRYNDHPSKTPRPFDAESFLCFSYQISIIMGTCLSHIRDMVACYNSCQVFLELLFSLMRFSDCARIGPGSVRSAAAALDSCVHVAFIINAHIDKVMTPLECP